MKTQKYYDRDHFTYEEKATICRKSNDQCCHCGKKVFTGYGATIDHFIPLNKGGSNNHINLVMLCHECNKEKNDKIFGIDYLPYLSSPHREKLDQYIKSYIRVMDITHRNRLLLYDEYTEELGAKVHDYKGHNRKVMPASKYKIKLATWDDLDRLSEYLIKYLKKNNALDDTRSARDNIVFWLHFGAIYYVEKNNEIHIMSAVTVKHITNEEGFKGNTHIPTMYLFSYYNNDYAYALAKNLVIAIPRLIIAEAHLNYIPFNLIMINEDKMLPRINKLFNNIQDDTIAGLSSIQFVVCDEVPTNEEIRDDNVRETDHRTVTFLSKFDDIASNVLKFYEKYEARSSISWMISSIYSLDKVRDTPLAKYFDDLKNISS